MNFQLIIRKKTGLRSFWASLVSAPNSQCKSLCVCQTGWLLFHRWLMDMHSSPCLKSYYCSALFCICVALIIIETHFLFWRLALLLHSNLKVFVQAFQIVLILRKLFWGIYLSLQALWLTFASFLWWWPADVLPTSGEGWQRRQVGELVSFHLHPLSNLAVL